MNVTVSVYEVCERVCDRAGVYALVYRHVIIIKENCLSVRQLVTGL